VFETLIKYTLETMPEIKFQNNKNIDYDNFIKKGIYKSYVDLYNKYNSIYLKNYELMEFRLFSSDNEIDMLIEYVRRTENLLTKCYYEYINNMQKSAIETQKLNLQTYINYSLIFIYDGELFFRNDMDNKLEKWKGDNKEFELALEFLFKKRGHTLQKLTYNGANLFEIQTLFKNKQYNYILQIKNNFIVSIRTINNQK